MAQTLCQKYSPVQTSDLILSGENELFKKDFDLSSSPNLLFIGQPGTGKTSLAKILAKPYDYLYINASDENGVDVIRNKITDFVKTASPFNNIKVVILDEADGLSSVGGAGTSAQQALRGLIEENLEYCKFILTANYEHKIIEALQSRCQTFYFSLSKKDIAIRLSQIIKAESISITKEDFQRLIVSFFPDLRKCINELQKGLDENNKFSFKSKVDFSFIEKIKKCIDGKVEIFALRESIIKEEDSFQGDYLNLMRGLFDLYCIDRNANAVKAICYHMEKHSTVMDKEVNFTSLLLNLYEL